MEQRYKHDPHLVVKPAFYSDGIPVFKPTMEQFQDFYKFNKAVNHYGMKSGIIKIIPPLEWQNQLHPVYTKEKLESVVIRNPIIQHVNSIAGFKGVYSSQNVERQRKYSLSQWLQLSKKPNYSPPSSKRRRNSTDRGPRDTKALNTRSKEHTHRPERSRTDTSKKVLDKDFNIEVSEFTPDRCSELENLYWRSLGYAEPMYGADVLGSLFQNSIESWNVAHLPNLLDLMEEKVPGVNDAYLYAGLWKATFSWHLEDQDLYSINYLHLGAPKQWYSIPQKDSTRFFDLMKDIFHEDFKKCSEFLRHKTFLASPAFLEKNGIRCNKIVHHQGEFIITYPYGYHAGFNYGYNLAESVNFALDEWFEFAAKTKKCGCIQDSVGINSTQIYCKFKGIPYDASVSCIKEKDTQSDSKTAEQKSLTKKRITSNVGQCVLCPIELPNSLLDFRQFELLPCDVSDPKSGNPLHVHRICSEAFPQYLKLSTKGGSSFVEGMKNIPRSFRSLKCLQCHLPNKYSVTGTSQGACFQCSVNTCTKSYHPICALSSGFLFNNQTCKVHRRSGSKFYGRQNDDYLKFASSLSKNSLIQFSRSASARRHTGEIQCGLIQSNNSKDHTLNVLIMPSLEQSIHIRYDDVLIGDSTDTDNGKFLDMIMRDALTTEKRAFASEAQEVQKKRPRKTSSENSCFVEQMETTPIQEQMEKSGESIKYESKNETKNEIRDGKNEISTEEKNENKSENIRAKIKRSSSPSQDRPSNTFSVEDLNTRSYSIERFSTYNDITNFNRGNFNPGNFNPGNFNPGNFNPGNFNSGNFNPGNFNPGNFNPGNFNPGNFNPGNSNTGNFNLGNINTYPYNYVNSNKKSVLNDGGIYKGYLNNQNCHNGGCDTCAFKHGNFNTGNINTSKLAADDMNNNLIARNTQHFQQSAMAPTFQPNTWHPLESNASHRYMTSSPASAPSIFNGPRYSFQHPRSFSDSSSWLLPMNRPAQAIFVNKPPENDMRGKSEGTTHFVPENFY